MLPAWHMPSYGQVFHNAGSNCGISWPQNLILNHASSKPSLSSLPTFYFTFFFVLSRPVNPYPANHDHGLLLAFTPESSQLHLSTPLLSSQQSPPPLISPTRSSDHDDVESSVESWIFLAHSQLPAGTIFTCFSFSLFFHTSHRSFLVLSDGPIS